MATRLNPEPSPEVAVRGLRRRPPKNLTLAEIDREVRAALYGRLSTVEADGTEEATSRQLDDSRDRAHGFGWQIAGEWVDSDFSGYDPRLERPDFEDLLRAIDDGEIDVIVVWKLDRLTRQPKQIERVIDLLLSEKLLGVYSIMEPLPLDPAGRTHMIKTLRDAVSIANYESAVKSERQKRANKARAERGEVGTTGGYRAFGFEVDGISHRPDEAAEIRRAVDLLLDHGWTLGGIVRDWRSRGIRTPERERRAVGKEPKRRRVDQGGEWRSSTLRNLLLNPKIAGLRAYRFDRATGEYDSVRQGKWEPIVPQDRWEMLCEKIRKHPGRGRSTARKYLLSGFAVCGAPVVGEDGRPKLDDDGNPVECRSTLRSNPYYRQRDLKKYAVPRMICPHPSSTTHRGCGKTAIFYEEAEREVISQLIGLMEKTSSPLRRAVLALRDDVEDEQAVVEEIDEIDRSIAEADFDHYQRRRSDPEYLPRDRHRAVVDGLKARRSSLLSARSRSRRRPMLEKLAENPRAVWEGWSFDERRAALGEALDYVVVAPKVPYARTFDPDRVVCRWKD